MSARNTHPVRRCRSCGRKRRGNLNVCISCQRRKQALRREGFRDEHAHRYRHVWRSQA